MTMAITPSTQTPQGRQPSTQRGPLASLRHTSLLRHPNRLSDATAGTRTPFGRSSIGSSKLSPFASVATASPSPSSSHSGFIPNPVVGGHKIDALGSGIPGFQTSFNVSGKGGGAFRPISDSFTVNPANGTLSLSLPIPTSPTRGGFGPELSLSYDSGGGNGPFGFGWNVGLPSIQRKTKNGVPRYIDGLDDFGFNGVDIVPALTSDGTRPLKSHVGDHEVLRYRPRVDSAASRIEKWTSKTDSADVHWRVISADNVTSIYGLDESSRISNNRNRIFSWLISRSYDPRGNAIEYVYKQEDGKGLADAAGCLQIWEQNRTQEARCRQKYIKSIRYGNLKPCRDLETWEISNTTWPQPGEWMFEAVFDYGGHDEDSPGATPTDEWKPRLDAFSQHNIGFEVRTYRLCRRVLMFHHFPVETGWKENLVTSSKLTYNESAQGTFLSSYTISAHTIDDLASGKVTGNTVPCYKNDYYPSWSFSYTTPPSPNQIKTMQANVANLIDTPQSGTSSLSEWLDLDGQGLPGLLTRLADGTMSYQRNRGKRSLCGSISDDETQFSTPELLSQQPSLGRGTDGRFDDLSHTGRLDLLHIGPDGRPQGFWEREDSDSWSAYSELPETPISEFSNPDSGLTGGIVESLHIDLTGDGLADVLYAMGDSQELIWEQNLGKTGMSGCRRSFTFGPSTRRPRIGLARTAESRVYAADMTGDGLADLVEISRSSVTYWPNQGHGTFGTAVEMGNPPIFACGDGPDSVFDHARLRLIDVDGNGTTDILYLLPGGGAHLYFNLAGNLWSKRYFIRALPATTSPSSVFTLDLFGQGSACLCWAETTSSSGELELRYVDLMAGSKPHLLSEYSNGFGAVTIVSYEPSTNFYLKDRRSGQPWTKKLPFPVQCVSQVTARDQITGTSMTTEYAYHNGCYDPHDKGFAGFEMVEQWKRETIILGKDETYEPPTRFTKSWFSVGQGLRVDESRFFSASFLSSNVQTLRDCNDNATEAFQTLKGKAIRTETCGLDGTPHATVPYSVEELSYDVKQVQAKGPNKYAVFQVTPRSSLSTAYARDSIEDKRITHDIVLRTNKYGDVEDSLSLVYPRSQAFASLSLSVDEDVMRNQRAGNVSHVKVYYTNAVGDDQNGMHSGCWRKPVVWRQQDHEILGMRLPSQGIMDVENVRRFDFATLPTQKPASDESTSHGTGCWRVLRSDEKAFFRNNALSDRLGEGKLEAFSILDQPYSLAFDDQILAKVKKNQDGCGVKVLVEKLMKEGGYCELDKDGCWWAPSSYLRFLDPKQQDREEKNQELLAARRSFYSPTVSIDPFGNSSFLRLDSNFLLAEEVQNAVGDCIFFNNDYHHLQPVQIKDQNGNRRASAIGGLGHVTAVAILGKGVNDPEDLFTDSLDALEVCINREDIDAILRDPCGPVTRRLLGTAGSRTVYGLDRYEKLPSLPAVIIEIERDCSYKQSDDPMLRVAVTYLDGHGLPIQHLQLNDPTSSDHRWQVASMEVKDISGHAVRSYEPFFTSKSDFVPASFSDRPGTTHFFDPIGHSLGTLTSDHVWSKSIHTPWENIEHDFGSAVLCLQPEQDPDIGHFFSRLKTSRYLPTWTQPGTLTAAATDTSTIAKSSTVYHGAVTITQLGSCGLPVRSVHTEPGKTFVHGQAFAYDVSGNKIRGYDALGRLDEKNVYDKLNRRILNSTMDAGHVGAIFDVAGSIIFSWNSRGVCFFYEYDELHRETGKKILQKDGSTQLVIKAVYGDSAPLASMQNLRGQVWKIYDQSGIHVSERFDLRGNAVATSYQLLEEYKNVIDWANPDSLVLRPPFTETARFDNFGQAVHQTDALGSQTSRRFSRLGQVVNVQFIHHKSSAPGSQKTYLKSATFQADGSPLVKTYESGVSTTYIYDELSRRLICEKTVRKSTGNRPKVIQDLVHTYDCAGRRIRTEDLAEQTAYFRDCKVKAVWEYAYDTLGQLIQASGRGQLPLAAKGGRDTKLKPHDATTGSKPATGVTDGKQLYRYVESYEYDLAGNITSMTHAAPDDKYVTGWTRQHRYEEQSLLGSNDGDKNTVVMSNRLSSTMVSGIEERYAYDEVDAGSVGCMTTLPKFSLLRWNMDNMLSASSTQNIRAGNGTPETTYYVYDYAGRRVRKVTESQSSHRDSGSDDDSTNGGSRKTRDAVYLGRVELQMRLGGDGVQTASTRSISRVTSEPGEILALVEWASDKEEEQVLDRYQTGNNLELDDNGRLITYEEYSPYGTVMYTSVHQNVEAPRAYRFARYEHDRETGLYHCGARYYCPWLGRWTSPDPLGDVDGPNLFEYCGNDPVGYDDALGTSRTGRDNKTSFMPKARSVSKTIRIRHSSVTDLKSGKGHSDGIQSLLASGVLKKVAEKSNKEYPQQLASKYPSIDMKNVNLKINKVNPNFHPQQGEGRPPFRALELPQINNNRGGQQQAQQPQPQAPSRAGISKAFTAFGFESQMADTSRLFHASSSQIAGHLSSSKQGDPPPPGWAEGIGRINGQVSDLNDLLGQDQPSPSAVQSAMGGTTAALNEFRNEFGGKIRVGTGEKEFDLAWELRSLKETQNKFDRAKGAWSNAVAGPRQRNASIAVLRPIQR